MNFFKVCASVFLVINLPEGTHSYTSSGYVNLFTMKDYKRAISKPDSLNLVYFRADNCRRCRYLNRKLENYFSHNKHTNLDLYIVDFCWGNKLFRRLDIKCTPTFHLYQNDVCVYEGTNVFSNKELLEDLWGVDNSL